MSRKVKQPSNIFTGAVFKSVKCGDFKVVEFKSSTAVVVKFESTGTVRTVSSQKVRNGAINDPLFPTVYGVGYIGEGFYKSKLNRVKSIQYATWHHMLERCYSSKYHKKKPTYKDCTVCEEWYDFQNFAKWFDENYPDDGFKYQLDKDKLVKGNKHYSPETCVFLVASENTIISKARSAALIDEQGFEHNIFNVSEFCRKHNLSQGNISAVLRGERKQHKGWTKKC